MGGSLGLLVGPCYIPLVSSFTEFRLPGLRVPQGRLRGDRRDVVGGVGQDNPRLPWSGMPPPWTGAFAPCRTPNVGRGPRAA